jgi:hypothetical protein
VTASPYIGCNLFHALRALRLQDRERVLWVDALCIDQENTDEKGHQVGQMRNVYVGTNVIVWLGAETSLTQKAFEVISTVADAVELGDSASA